MFIKLVFFNFKKYTIFMLVKLFLIYEIPLFCEKYILKLTGKIDFILKQL